MLSSVRPALAIRRGLLVLLLFFVPLNNSFAGTIKGTVLDARTQEPLAGVRIALKTSEVKSKKQGAISGLNGTYTVNELAAARYTVTVTYPGYKASTFDFELKSVDEVLNKNISLKRLEYNEAEIVVTGHLSAGSEAGAQAQIKNSAQVINTLSTRAIELSPDLSVADVSQRVSGVSISRTSSGDGQYAIIRGMDKRYNYTLVNGVKIPSPDNKNRYVPLDIFSAEMLDRLDVTKSLLPTMEGDAIGGAIDLVMKQAPYQAIASVEAGTSYSGLFLDRKFYSVDASSTNQSPRLAKGAAYKASLNSDFPLSAFDPVSKIGMPGGLFSATVGDRFLDDRALGLLVSGSYQSAARGANSIYFRTDVNPETNSPRLTDVENRVYSTLQSRLGVETNVDYKIDNASKIALFGMYASLIRDEFRDVYDTVLGLGWPATTRVPTKRRSTHEVQTIGNATLSGTQSIFGEHLGAEWKLVYSLAKLNEPDRAELDLYTGNHLDNQGNVVSEPTYLNSGSTRTWSSSIDVDKSAYVTLRSMESLFGLSTEFAYGGMYRAKTRESSYDQYSLRATPSPQTYDGDITKNTFEVFNPYGTSDAPLDYNAHENVTAGFLQVHFQFGDLSTTGGVRIENTDFGWSTAVPVTAAGKFGTIGYIDYLPSVSFKYRLTTDQNLKLSYFKAISRPGYYEVIPNYGVETDEYTEQSNPYLQPTRADNIDARWEYFPTGLDQLLVGAFYKRISDPIEYAVKIQNTSSYLVPNNFGTATNFGFEFDIRKFFSAFGIAANYTFTQSSITTAKTVRYRSADPNIGLTERIDKQTRPLQGQSEHIANLSLLYKSFESGSDAQLSAIYTGPHIVSVSPFKDNDVWQSGFLQLDFSAEKQIFGSFAVYLKVKNILNAPLENVIRRPYEQVGSTAVSSQVVGKDVLIRRDKYDRTYSFGIRYRL